MKFIVYMHTCRVTGKAYIGITGKTVEKRFAEHCGDAAARRGRGQFHAAIRRHGRDAWTSEILHTVETAEDAKALEILEIANHGTLWPCGYNRTLGGDGTFGHTHDAEALAKRSGAKHVQSKGYVVTHPDGSEEEILGLTDFCRQRGLDHRKAHATTWNPGIQCKGYRFRLVGADPVPFTPRPRGERLTDAQRIEIARLIEKGVLSKRAIAEQFGVSDQTVRNIERKAKAGQSVRGVEKGASFIVEHPDGREEAVVNMTEWCRTHDVSRASAGWCCAQAGRKHKGFGFRRAA